MNLRPWPPVDDKAFSPGFLHFQRKAADNNNGLAWWAKEKMTNHNENWKTFIRRAYNARAKILPMINNYILLLVFLEERAKIYILKGMQSK